MALELKPEHNIAASMSALAVNLKGDFCWSRSFDRKFICRLMYEGFLTMAHKEMGGVLLLPKLHEQRCLLDLARLRIPKRIRQVSHPFSISMNQDFEGVIKGCKKQHGTHCWLYPQLVDVFREIHSSGGDGPIRVATVEIWSEGKLVGGEIGVSCGACFTSYSGFKTLDSAGTVQCLALGKYLRDKGYKLWDLGMGMKYKYTFGAQDSPRLMFLARFRKVRDEPSPVLTTIPIPCANLFPVPGQAVEGLSFHVAPVVKPQPPRNPDSKRQRKYRAKKERIAGYKAARQQAKLQQPQAAAVSSSSPPADNETGIADALLESAAESK